MLRRIHNTPYDSKFYSAQSDGSLESARIVARLISQLIQPEKVLDVGCAHGGWLRAFSEYGARSLRGLDGDYVDRAKLQIDTTDFIAVDLAEEFEVDGSYDLAICVEVAEHLPRQRSQHLIDSLTHAAPVVLFSAAVPGQGGTAHINEQWPEYWRDLFNVRGFKMLDVVRPSIRDNERVVWWYRQNLMLFANAAALNMHPALSTATNGTDLPIEWIHINMLREAGVRSLLHIFTRVLFPALVGAVNRKLGSKGLG